MGTNMSQHIYGIWSYIYTMLLVLFIIASVFGITYGAGVRSTRRASSHGDSYSNTAFDPMGIQPAPGNPLGNPDLDLTVPEDADLTRGANWVYDVTTVYNSTTMLTYNLAFDCAVVNFTLIPDDCPFARDWSVINQTNTAEEIIKKGSQYGHFDAENTLFSIFIGINDASIPVKNYRVGLEETLTKDSNDLFEQLDRIYNLGFRQFLILSVPSYDRTPQVQNTGNATYIQAQQHAITVWNDALKRNYDRWTDNHHDLNSFLFDTKGVFNDVLDDPKAFGANATGAKCFGTLPDCLWADDFHPGPAVHRYLARSIARYAGFKFSDFLTLAGKS